VRLRPLRPVGRHQGEAIERIGIERHSVNNAN
jgi:hypothetical protein